MLRQNYQLILKLSLVVSLFFLSNASAFFHVVWIVPGIVYLELVAWLILTLFCLWILLKHNFGSEFLERVNSNWMLLPFVIYCGVSISWSVYWEISLSRWLIFLCTIIAAGYIGIQYSIKEIVKLLSVFGIYILLISSTIIMFTPKIGIMNYYIIQGAWRGIYWHKNHMGLIAAFINILFLLSFVSSIQSREKNSFFWGIAYLFSLFFVYKTDSVAAYITVLGLHGLIFLASIFLKYKEKTNIRHYGAFVLVVTIASILFYINSDYFFKLFNRSPTLTGRIPMWTYVFDTYFSQRPVWGYGFNAFWYIDSYRKDIGLAAGYPDPIVIADNGFIDMLMNTGYVGIILFALFYFGAWWFSIKYASRAKDIYTMFPVILMSYTLIANFSWSLLFENEGFFMLIMISILFSMSVKTPMSSEN